MSQEKAAYAVLVPLVETKDGVCLLFEKRSEFVPQPGDVCFPGGQIEGNETPEEAALRETYEELHIPAEDITIAHLMEPIRNMKGWLIQPVVAWLKNEALEKISLQTAEVAEAFTIPVKWLAENPPKEIFGFRYVSPDRKCLVFLFRGIV